MAERLVRVRSFGELRAGMLVVVKECDFCLGTHRGILLKYTEEDGETDEGEIESGPGWELQPPACDGEDLIIQPAAVNDGVVFRVVEGLEQTSESHAELPRKLERVQP